MNKQPVIDLLNSKIADLEAQIKPLQADMDNYKDAISYWEKYEASTTDALSNGTTTETTRPVDAEFLSKVNQSNPILGDGTRQVNNDLASQANLNTPSDTVKFG